MAWRFLLPLLHICPVAALALLASDAPILDGAGRYLIFADLPISVVLVAPLIVMDVPAPLVIGVGARCGGIYWAVMPTR
jgi:hypothetical protein